MFQHISESVGAVQALATSIREVRKNYTYRNVVVFSSFVGGGDVCQVLDDLFCVLRLAGSWLTSERQNVKFKKNRNPQWNTQISELFGKTKQDRNDAEWHCPSVALQICV